MRLIKYFLLLIFIFSTAFAKNPYQLNWSKDGAIGAGAVVNAFLANMVDNSIQPLTTSEISALSRNDVNSFDRFATYNYSEPILKASDIGLLTTTLAPLLLLASPDIDENGIATIAIMYLETIGIAAYLPSYAKGGFQRVRPYVYNPDAPLDIKTSTEAKRSFFSGHATIAFASAVFLSTVYSDYFPDSRWEPYVWGGSLLAASIVGILRIEGGMHYPTDVIMGAVVGSLVGYLIPYIHRKENSRAYVTVNAPVPSNQIHIGFVF